jgi:hypothetical protein
MIAESKECLSYKHDNVVIRLLTSAHLLGYAPKPTYDQCCLENIDRKGD